MRTTRKLSSAAGLLALAWPGAAVLAQSDAPGPAVAGHPDSVRETYSPRGIGDPGMLFDSHDENFNPVSMAELIDGRPLVLAVSSCT
jgi:hypothetical protein